VFKVLDLIGNATFQDSIVRILEGCLHRDCLSQVTNDLVLWIKGIILDNNVFYSFYPFGNSSTSTLYTLF